MPKGNRPKSLLFFYLLLGYVLIQLTWWGYMIIDLNLEIANEENLLNTPNTKNKMFLMVIGEGSVFILILGLAASKIRKTFKQEMDLANQQKNFLSSITHELKSPISSINLYLQTIQKRKLSKEKKEEIISRALNDTNRLKVLVEKILTATRINSSNYSPYFEKTNISSLSYEVLNSLSETIGRHHKNIFEIDPNILWNTDLLAFRSILTNLYENAIKYSPKDSKLKVELKIKDTKLLLRVIDEGIGIPNSLKNKVFQRFFRQGQEETRKTKGTGLGLYIVKELTELLNGKIKIEDNIPRGCIFAATFNSKKINE